MILVDTSGLLAALLPGQRYHEACVSVLQEARGPLLLSPFVLAELDYLLAKLAAAQAELALLDEVGRGAYVLADFKATDVQAARRVVARYADLNLGLADASIVALAQRHKARDVLTLDERHFGALRGPRGAGFRLLPRDT